MTWKPFVLVGLAACLAFTGPVAAAPAADQKQAQKPDKDKAEKDKPAKPGPDCDCACDHRHHGKGHHHGHCKHHHKGHCKGAIFTTDQGGDLLPGDLYEQAQDVYLNGGPPVSYLKKCWKDKKDKNHCDVERKSVLGQLRKKGLPDGRYYFQVTNPDGSRLLSLRPLAERQVEVRDGYIQGGTTSHQLVELAKPFPRAYTIVQLWPFAETDHESGEYKVWLTPVGAYQAGKGSFGFQQGCSRTDAFKVKIGGASVISGFVFEDANRDRVWDMDAEATVQSVPLEIYEAGSATPLDIAFSGSMGAYGFQVTPTRYPATYEIRPLDQGWFAPTQAPVLVVTLLAGGSTVSRVDLGVVFVGEAQTNVGLSPAYWASGFGETVIRAGLWPSDRDPVPPVLNAGILKQSACLSHGPFGSLAQVDDFLLDNVFSADPLCAMSSFWLGVSLALASEGDAVPADGVYFTEPFNAQTASAEAVVYAGLDPTSGEPVFMALGDLLSLVASDFGAFSPADQSFYLHALEGVANNATFLLDQD